MSLVFTLYLTFQKLTHNIQCNTHKFTLSLKPYTNNTKPIQNQNPSAKARVSKFVFSFFTLINMRKIIQDKKSHKLLSTKAHYREPFEKFDVNSFYNPNSKIVPSKLEHNELTAIFDENANRLTGIHKFLLFRMFF